MAVSLERFAIARRRMVDEQIRARGVMNERVLAAMEKVPREAFVPEAMATQAYLDRPVHIGSAQTISQPFIVARMTAALNLTGTEKVLEIGTGSAYQTAILIELAAQVYSIERIRPMSHKARKTLFSLGYDGFQLRAGDGTQGWPEEAPFDAIIVTAGGDRIPQPYLDQLADGGRLVVPYGGATEQRLCLCIRHGDEFEQQDLGPCRFVPLIGQHGWASDHRQEKGGV